MEHSTTIKQTAAHSSQSKARLASLMQLPEEHSAQDCYIYDQHGKAYLDCGGFGVFLCGHRHPTIVDAVKEQIDRMPMSSRTLLSPILAQASTALAKICPPSLEHVFFCNSGAEATELALKLAKAYGCKNIIALEGSYHGKTLGALSVTHRASFRTPFEPMINPVSFVPVNDFAAIVEKVEQNSTPSVIILEPVQGEAGVIVPDIEYLNNIQQLCEQTGTILIVDEIQSGLGRTGQMWAHTRSQLKPDIMLVGKGLSGGVVPCAAVVSRKALHHPIDHDFVIHSSTFGGSPIALAAAISTLTVIKEEQLDKKAQQLGQKIHNELRLICKDKAIEIRAQGLLIGIDCQTPELAGTIMMRLLKERVICCLSLSKTTTIRLTPSALLQEKELLHLFSALRKAIL